MSRTEPTSGEQSRNVATADSRPNHVQISWLDNALHLPSNSRVAPTGANPAESNPRNAVFLDRDGVLVEDVHFLSAPSQLNILPGVTQGLRALQERYYLVVTTNQSGIARGMFTEEDLLAIHCELVRQLSDEDVWVDALYYCPHLPEAPVPTYGLDCDCRKPKPGMLFRARDSWNIDLSNSYMIGDSPRDVEAGIAAGVSSILLGQTTAVAPAGAVGADNLAAAAKLILSN